MSGILFVTESLNPQSLNQIEILRKSGQKFKVITAESSAEHAPANTETLLFFRTWSWLEYIRFFPRLWQINPDVIYFFVDSETSVRKLWPFFRLAQSMGKIRMSHFFLLEESIKNSFEIRHFIYYSDLVVGPNRAFLAELRGIGSYSKHQTKGVVYPALSETSKTLEPSDSIDYSNYGIYIPVIKNKMPHELIKALSKNASLLIGFDFSAWTPQTIKKEKIWLHSLTTPWTLYPIEHRDQLIQWLPQKVNKHLIVWLSGIEFSLGDLIQIITYGINHRLNFVIDRNQFKIFPDLWDSYAQVEVIDANNFIETIPTIDFSSKETSNTWVNFNDLIVNEFNRLLSRTLHGQTEKIS